MAVPVFTFEAFGIANQTLQAWNFTDPILTINNQVASELTMRMPGVNVLAQEIIPYFTLCRLRRDGVKIFEGRQVTDRRRVRASGGASDTFTFLDAWHELSLTPFQQIWSYRPVGSAVVTKRFSRYNLFQDYTTGALITNGQQIVDVLNYAIQQCGINLVVGTIEPATNLPIVPARAMMCSEIITKAMEPSPDAVAYIDYSTNPPTFNVRLRRKPDNTTTLVPITMPFNAAVAGVVHESSEIASRYDLIFDQVVIDYKKVNTQTINGQSGSWTEFVTDAYPPGSNGQSVGALVLPIDLQGAAVVNLSGTISAAVFDVTDLNWWAKKHHHFVDPRVTGLTLLGGFGDATHPVTVQDDNKVNINLANFPRELLKGTVNPWMEITPGNAVNVIEATVTAWFTWAEIDQKGVKSKQHEDMQVSVRVKLTNSPVGDQVYQVRASTDTGEFTAPNLAQNLWQSSQQLHFEGEHRVREQDPSQPMQIVGPWNLLNLSGGVAAWATMNAAIQSATHDFFAGATDIRIGPPAIISAGDKAQLMIWARGRWVTENPNTRTTGQASGGGATTEVGKETPRENTTSGISQPSFQAVAKFDDTSGANKNLHLDAVAHEQQINFIDVGTGLPLWNKGGFSLKVEDTKGSDGLYHKMYAQEEFCYDANCVQKKRMIYASDPY